MREDKKITLEERFEKLEDILNAMEQNTVTLDEAFDLYKSGIEQVKACNAMLGDMEKAMLVLNENGELEEF